MESRIILNSSEQARVMQVIRDFHDIHKEITELEGKIHKLSDHKGTLLQVLNSKRENDVLLHDELTFKYGDGKIDVHTFEWVLNNTEDDTNEKNIKCDLRIV